MMLAYDARHRLDILSHRTAGGTLLGMYDYTVDLAGNRTDVQELNRTVHWNYDGLYRLTRETVVGNPGTTRTVDYGYDDVGNRLTRTVHHPGGTVETEIAWPVKIA